MLRSRTPLLPQCLEADDWENAGQSEENVEEIPQREVDGRRIESRMSLTPCTDEREVEGAWLCGSWI